MRRAVDYILREDRQDQDGYFGGKDGSRMYGHGIVTLAICEMLSLGLDAQRLLDRTGLGNRTRPEVPRPRAPDSGVPVDVQRPFS